MSKPRSRPITKGPAFHWFGYYDKLQFDPAGSNVLGMAVGFEGRSPLPGDVIEIGVIDLGAADRWTVLGESRAWCWQQGCMLQWIPGRHGEVIWNDRAGGRFISHILNVETGERHTLPHPVYALAPDGRSAVTVDFSRINDMRPGYGYAGIPDRNRDCLAPDESGIWRVDLETGGSELIVTLAEVARIPYAYADLAGAKHYFNHLLVNPAGTRFVFLHRWRFGQDRFFTRMLTAGLDGADIRVIDDSGHTSHFCWRDAGHVLAFSTPVGNRPGFYLFEGAMGRPDLVIDDPVDGHCTYLPGGEWIVSDTYPIGPDREQELYLYNVATGGRLSLGRFPTPLNYTGEWRCDLHPRVSPMGNRIVIDSAHGGNGRQMYLIEMQSDHVALHVRDIQVIQKGHGL